MPYGQWSQRDAPRVRKMFFPYRLSPSIFECHPQVEPTEEGPEGKAAEVFSIEVKESKPVARKKVGIIGRKKG